MTGAMMAEFYVAIGYHALSFLLGGLVGLAELLSNYTWRAKGIFKTWAGIIYLTVNGIAALLAYCAAIEWDFHAGLENKSEFWRVLVISLFGMAFLRSSFANIRVGDRDIGAGLSVFLEIFSKRAERVLDQQLTTERWEKVASNIHGLTYAASKNYLVAATQSALRSLSEGEIDQFNRDVEKIDALISEDITKMQLLAVRIVELTNLDLFISFAKKAREQLADQNAAVTKSTEAKKERLKEMQAFLRKER